jgi:FKBP-type peptidyl-prolyl cis-trans isomerase SlyD
MQIQNNMAVTIHYTLTNDTGEQLDSSVGQEPLVYLHGCGNIIQGLEDALTGKSVNDRFTVRIPPEMAYGLRKDEMTQVVPISVFNDMGDITEGMQFHAETNQGMSVVTISKIDGDQVTIDGNHPLSGEALTFDVEVVDIRQASEDELAHGHIHSGSCQH